MPDAPVDNGTGAWYGAGLATCQGWNSAEPQGALYAEMHETFPGYLPGVALPGINNAEASPNSWYVAERHICADVRERRQEQSSERGGPISAPNEWHVSEDPAIVQVHSSSGHAFPGHPLLEAVPPPPVLPPVLDSPIHHSSPPPPPPDDLAALHAQWIARSQRTSAQTT